MQNVNEENWDYLIILDACRYDYFEELYSNYFQGKLEKRRSLGSATPEWLDKTFTSKYDYTYLSANPFVNSQGFSLVDTRNRYGSDWNAIEHFSEIIDSWNLDWCDSEETVLSEDVMERAMGLDSKVIVHLIQPHRPFISCSEVFPHWKARRVINQRVTQGESLGFMDRLFDSYFGGLLKKPFGLLSYEVRGKIRKLLSRQGSYDDILAIYTHSEVRKFYYENLKIVMDSICSFIDELDGKVIISSDHGECLGEYDMWGHRPETDVPMLKNVPWFEVGGVK